MLICSVPRAGLNKKKVPLGWSQETSQRTKTMLFNRLTNKMFLEFVYIDLISINLHLINYLFICEGTIEKDGKILQRFYLIELECKIFLGILRLLGSSRRRRAS